MVEMGGNNKSRTNRKISLFSSMRKFEVANTRSSLSCGGPGHHYFISSCSIMLLGDFIPGFLGLQDLSHREI